MKQKRKEANLIAALVMTAILLAWAAGGQAALLYDNGPMVNSPGTHPDGSDESIIRSALLGFGIYGFGAQHTAAGYAVADNFTIAADTDWSVSSFDLYVYQTGAADNASITAAYLRIWDGNPATGIRTVVWGDNTTNVLTSAAFTDIFIVQDNPGTAYDGRRIQHVVVNTDNLTLGPGTYWAEWSYDGSVSYTGPWQPPIRIDNETTTGDAVRWITNAWNTAFDVGQQGLPFKVNGESCLDQDGDGYGAGSLCAGTDCNDNDAAIHATVTYYPDVDGDGYGNADNDSEFCSLTPPAGYVDNSSGFDVDDTDPFYTDILPTCEVKIIPKTLGWLVGDKEKTRFLLVIGKRGTEFGDTPVVKWESDAVDVVSTRVFFKRFMLMRATFNGEPLDKQEYRVLVGDCEGTITWAR